MKKNRKRIFEAYQKFLKINPASYTASSNLFQKQGFSDFAATNIKEPYDLSQQSYNTPIIKINTTSTLREEKFSVRNEQEHIKNGNFGHELTYKERYSSCFDSNRYKSTDSFFNLDQYAQPFALASPVETPKTGEGRETYTNLRQDDKYLEKPNYQGNQGFGNIASGGGALNINSSQLFNDYFIKNNLNK